jgi:nucleoside-diphosphate-sugar epimerase
VLDFVWVGQVVEALMRTAELEGATPPINIGSGTGTRIVDLARRIRLMAGTRSQIELVPARAVEVVQYVARIDRMRQLLRVEPTPDPLAHLAQLIRAPMIALA